MEIKKPETLNPTFYFIFAFYLGWIGAWLLKLSLDDRISWIKTDEGAFVYWLIAKLLIWVLPSFLFLRFLGKRFRDVFGRQNLTWALIGGGGIGSLITVWNVCVKTFIFHKPILTDRPFLTFVNVVFVAAIVEEIAFRGAVLSGFLASYGFRAANLLTALFFFGIHLPGWYFQGEFLSHFTSMQALAVFLLGLIFGYIVWKSNSLIGAMLAHALNNLSS